MLIKEKIKSIWICAFLSLVVSIFGLCLCGMPSGVVLAEDSGTMTPEVTISFAFDSTIISSNTATTDYNGCVHTLQANIAYSGETDEYKWYYKKNSDSSFNQIDDNSRYNNNISEKYSTINIKNVAQSGIYCLGVYNEEKLLKQSNEITVTIKPESFDLTISQVKEDKAFDETDTIEIVSSSFDEDSMLSDVDKTENILPIGILHTADAGDNIYIEKVILVDVDGTTEKNKTLNENYTINPTFTCSRYVNVAKKDVSIEIKLDNKEFVASDTSYYADYTGEDYGPRLKMLYKDVSGASVYVKIGYAYPTGSLSPNYLIDANDYMLKAIKQESDKNYNFVDGNKYFKIKKINPTFIFSSTKPVYTGATQNIADFVKVNNSEQTIKFANNVTTFTTLADWATIKSNKFTVEESKNYVSMTGTFPNDFDMEKGELVVGLAKSEYEYNDGNNIKVEYTISPSLEGVELTQKTTVTKVEENKNVELYFAGSDNYKQKTYTVTINVVPQVVNVSGYKWNYNGLGLQYKGDKFEILLKDIPSEDEGKIDIVYEGNKEQSVGTYLAKVKITAKDGYKIEGYVEPLFYEIYKLEIPIPKLKSEITSFVYKVGEKQGLEFRETISDNMYLISNNVEINAGKYQAIASLNDKSNTCWKGGSSEDLTFDWEITKQIVRVSKYKTVLVYGGFEQSLDVKENEFYYVIGDSAIDIGEYKTVLVLKDKNNFAFDKNGSGEYIINWKITGDKEGAGLPIALIVLVTILVTGLGVFFTLRYTFVTKEKQERKKRLEEKLKKTSKTK